MVKWGKQGERWWGGDHLLNWGKQGERWWGGDHLLNPISLPPSYVLSHIKDLTYLDYRRVAAADVTSAKEQHQVGG